MPRCRSSRVSSPRGLLEDARSVYSRPVMTLRVPVSFAVLIAASSLACASQKVEPQVASSTAQTHYAVEYPDRLQAIANEYVNTEGDVGRITSDFPKYPGQLKDPHWPLVVTIVNRADEAGRSASYV